MLSSYFILHHLHSTPTRPTQNITCSSRIAKNPITSTETSEHPQLCKFCRKYHDQDHDPEADGTLELLGAHQHAKTTMGTTYCCSRQPRAGIYDLTGTASTIIAAAAHDYATNRDFLFRHSFTKFALSTPAHAFVATLTNGFNAPSVFFNLDSFPITTVTPSRLHVCSTKPPRPYSQPPYSLYDTTALIFYMAWNDFHTLSHLHSSNMFLTLFAMAFQRLFRSYGIKDLVGRYKAQTKI
jgi:hypothetical protein